MSFDNVHPNRKDWRKPYHGSKAFDRSCRCGGNCGWCESNRRIGDKKLKQKAEDDCDVISEIHQRRSIALGED